MIVKSDSGKHELTLTDREISIVLTTLIRSSAKWDVLCSDGNETIFSSEDVSNLAAKLCKTICEDCDGGILFGGRKDGR